MAGFGTKWLMLMIFCSFMLASAFVSGERSFKHEASTLNVTKEAGFNSNYLSKVVNFLWQSDRSGYHHVWPEMEFGWQIVVGSIIGFFGAAFGSVGGVGGGGIFVPMLSLVIGFDPKSATALSKCKKQTHPCGRSAVEDLIHSNQIQNIGSGIREW